jgi:HAD superfamily hydrolase (TIGR01490 family)
LNLAIFDLDNTLLTGDSDYLWGQYLVKQGLVDADFYESENQRYYDEYKAGTLDIFAFLKFSFQPLANNELEQLLRFRKKFISEHILPIIPDAARALLDKHRKQNHYILIITATNLFITEPIARELSADDIIATEPEFKNDRYTGEVSGTPCFQEGKVTRLNSWLETKNKTLDNSWFYSDSHNDLPLLKLVTHPVAVDPDEILAQVAIEQGWPIISLRNESA